MLIKIGYPNLLHGCEFIINNEFELFKLNSDCWMFDLFDSIYMNKG